MGQDIKLQQALAQLWAIADDYDSRRLLSAPDCFPTIGAFADDAPDIHFALLNGLLDSSLSDKTNNTFEYVALFSSAKALQSSIPDVSHQPFSYSENMTRKWNSKQFSLSYSNDTWAN